MTDQPRSMLTAGARVTLNASGNGTIKFGPADTRGAANWNVTGVIVQTSRPGLAPVPRIQIWLDHEDETGVQGLSYDGSFAQGHCDFTMQRGQQIIATWTGGQSGDIAMLTVTGEKW